MNTVRIIISIIFGIIGIMALFFGIFSVSYALGVFFRFLKGEVDEREKMIVLKAFAYTMMIVMLIHLAQFVIGCIVHEKFVERGTYFIPVITGGFQHLSIISNNPLHVEAIIFDGAVFGAFLQGLRKKYGE